MTSEDPPDQEAITCSSCGRTVLASVRGRVFVAPNYNHSNGWHVPAVVTLLQCQNCSDPALILQEDYGAGFDDPFQLWPAISQLSVAIPERLRSELSEARDCFKIKAYRAAAVMVRRTVEGLVTEQKATGRNLNDQLGSLEKAGVIDARLVAWAHGLRILGNEGAHYSTPTIDRQDAQDALDLAEALLDYVYVFSERFRAFEKRRSASETQAAESVGNM